MAGSTDKSFCENKLNGKRVLVTGGTKEGIGEAIETYFHASNAYDSNLLYTCFIEDAILYDEGLAYHGSAAIEAHIVKENNNLLVKTDVANVIVSNEETVVTATISGNFEGSPIALDYHFTIKELKIATLKIVLSGE